MIKNYLKIALRIIFSQKLYSLINIFGLTIGLTSVILIMLYVSDELSFDKFHKGHENIYRVVENQYYAGQPVFPVAVTPPPLGPSLKDEYPEITHATRFLFNTNRFEYEEMSFLEEGAMADAELFNIFSFRLIEGDVSGIFKQKNSVVISQKLAKKYFSDISPIGKVIKFDGEDDMLVTGVFENVPVNSHLQFDFVIPLDKLKDTWQNMDTSWGSNTLYTYLKVEPNTNIEQLNEKIIGQIKKNRENSVTDIYLQPLTDIHLGKVDFTADVTGKGNIAYVEIFTLVAVFILVIACINFMNLATARSARRAKEVGLRKTVGANRFQLVYQFLGESVLMTIIAMLISIFLVDLLLPGFNQLSGKALEFNPLNLDKAIRTLGLIGLAAVFTGLLAGSYPAIFLSSFQPSSVLKGQKVKGGKSFRRALVILQFVVSIVLVIGTITVSQQLNYIQNKSLGLDKERVIYIRGASENPEVFTNELLKHEGIRSIGISNQHPAYVENSTSGISWEGANPDETILIHTIVVDEGFIPTMNIEMAQGRNFSKDILSDSAAVIVNEKALKIIGYNDPIGAKLRGASERTIIGVVKDFHFKSIHQQIEPLIMYIDRDNLSRTFIKIETTNTKEVKEKIETVWSELNPKNTFNFKFLDEDYNNLYASEERTSRLFRYFSALAILISCLGLFGLSSYMAEQRLKEISIRKVMGAPMAKLLYLMSKDFAVLVFVAFIISVPLGWYFMNRWLQAFAYRIELGIIVFIASGGLALLIAIITVSYQSYAAAASNPVNNLRNE